VKLPVCLTALVAVFYSSALSAPIVDDFNDNQDNGWTRYAPLGPASATFTLQNGTYRIQAAATPNPAVGDGRAGGLRLGQEETFSDFVVSADVVAFDGALLQAFGSLARITTPGAATTAGYGFVYDHESTEIIIVRIDGEVPTTIGTATDLTLNPADDYRFVFTGTGSDFVGQVYDLTNGAALLGTVLATDAAYATGNTGLVSASLDNAHAADATFDNFSAVPEPSATIALLGLSGLAAGLTRRKAFRVP